jgi:hypothetical protein
MAAHESSEDVDPIDRILDAFVYAPIGLLLDGKDLIPDLAKRGRAQAANARVLGTFALSTADTRVQTAIADVERQLGVLFSALAGSATSAKTDGGAERPTKSPPTATSASTKSKSSPAKAPAKKRAKPVVKAAGRAPTKAKRSPPKPPAVGSLAIDGYDTLAASQIVSRLEGLTPAERKAVVRFESANRKRKSILDKIGRLDASRGV